MFRDRKIYQQQYYILYVLKNNLFVCTSSTYLSTNPTPVFLIFVAFLLLSASDIGISARVNNILKNYFKGNG